MNIELEFASVSDRVSGWRLDPVFLKGISDTIEDTFGDDEDIPTLEQIELVLLALIEKN